MIVTEEAERRSSKARIALDGPSGAGKTWTALVIAMLFKKLSGSTKKPILVDSEHASAIKYSLKRGTEEADGNWRFAHIAMTDKTPDEYSEALSVTAQRGDEIVIIDSLSHLWTKTLELIDRGGGWTKAGKVLGPRYQSVIDQIVAHPGHVICTLRADSGIVVEMKDGKSNIKKHGLEAVIRKGAEFEFDLWLNLDGPSGTLTVSKSRFGKVAPVGEVYERSQLPRLIENLLRELDAGTPANPVDVFTEKIRFVQSQAALDGVVAEITAAVASGTITEGDKVKLRPAFTAKKREIEGVES